MKQNTDPQLRSLAELNVSADPRADHADVTNAPELFGDVFGDLMGDADNEAGDLYGDLYGDAASEEGDVINDSTLAAFKMISGDPEVGGPKHHLHMPHLKLHRPSKHSMVKAGKIAALAAATGLSVAAIRKLYLSHKAKSNKIHEALSHHADAQTIQMQRAARENAGKIHPFKKTPFFQVIGAKMNQSPIDPMEGFPADMWKFNLDKQAAETPFYQETAIGTLVGLNWVATATGTVASRYYTALFLQIGINFLNAAPGTVFVVTGTFPTAAGTLTVAATPWTFTIENKYDVRFQLFPWQLVSNRPFMVIGTYSNANPISVTVAGLPTASAVSLIVPGSLHPWIVAMRQALTPQL